MQAFKDDQQSYYKKMLDLQEKLRKSEEERIRLEERFNFLVKESQIRHQNCINRLRIRYVEFLEEQRIRDERNNKLLGSLNKVDNSLAIMSAKTERLNVLRKHYEAYLLRVYGHDRGNESFGTAEGKLGGPASQTAAAFGFRLFAPSRRDVTQESLPNLYCEQNRQLGALSSLPRKYAMPTDSSADKGARSFASTAPASRSLWKRAALPSDGESDTLQAKLESETALLSRFGGSLASKLLEPDLDSYIGKIKQLHVEETRARPSADGRDRSSLDEPEPEQNTSGDLLNASLSEDLERSLASPSAGERRADAAPADAAERPEDGADDEDERLGDAEIEDDYDESVDIDSWMPDDREEEEEEEEVHPRDSIRNRPRRTLESIEEVEQGEDELADAEPEPRGLPPGAANDLAAQPEPTAYASERSAIEQQQQQEQQSQLQDQQVPDVELFEQVQGGQTEQYPLEAAAGQLGYAYDVAEYQYDGGDYDPSHAQQQQPYYGQQYDGEYAAPGEEYLQEYGSVANYEQQQQQQQQQSEAYEQLEEGQDYRQHGPADEYYPMGYDGVCADGGEQQQAFGDETAYGGESAVDETYEYAQQVENSGPSQVSARQEPEPSSAQAATPQPEDHSDSGSRQQSRMTTSKRKKDAIKSILDSDSDSLIERKLSNSESDFDFN